MCLFYAVYYTTGNTTRIKKKGTAGDLIKPVFPSLKFGPTKSFNKSDHYHKYSAGGYQIDGDSPHISSTAATSGKTRFTSPSPTEVSDVETSVSTGSPPTEASDVESSVSTRPSNAESSDLETDNQLERHDAETDNQLERHVETDNQLEHHVETDNQLERHVETDNQLERQVETDNQLERHVETDNQRESHVETDNQLERHVETDKQLERHVETDNQLERHVQVDYLFPRQNALRRTNDEACEKRNYIVHLCRKGDNCRGWGDRQKGIVSSYLLALLTNRFFVIVHDDPCPLTNFLVPNSHNWTSCTDYVLNVPLFKTQTLHYYNEEYAFRDTIASTDFDVTLNKQVVFIKTNQIWTTYVLANEKAKRNIPSTVGKGIMEINRNILKRLFRPTITLQQEIMKYMENVHQQQKLVCSHIRTGKNPSMPQDKAKGDSQRTVQTIFHFLKKYDIPSQYMIYVATDSDAVKKKLKDTFHSCFTVDQPIVHVALYRAHENACKGFKTALLEQHLLSKCHVLIYTRSSFGRLASYMNDVMQGLYFYDPIKQSIVNQTHYLSL